jgi:hypothetical protein
MRWHVERERVGTSVFPIVVRVFIPPSEVLRRGCSMLPFCGVPIGAFHTRLNEHGIRPIVSRGTRLRFATPKLLPGIDRSMTPGVLIAWNFNEIAPRFDSSRHFRLDAVLASHAPFEETHGPDQTQARRYCSYGIRLHRSGVRTHRHEAKHVAPTLIPDKGNLDSRRDASRAIAHLRPHTPTEACEVGIIQQIEIPLTWRTHCASAPQGDSFVGDRSPLSGARARSVDAVQGHTNVLRAVQESDLRIDATKES